MLKYCWNNLVWMVYRLENKYIVKSKRNYSYLTKDCLITGYPLIRCARYFPFPPSYLLKSLCTDIGSTNYLFLPY